MATDRTRSHIEKGENNLNASERITAWELSERRLTSLQILRAEYHEMLEVSVESLLLRKGQVWFVPLRQILFFLGSMIFLPWIHDMFLSVDGSSIEFIAQNKRRCKTGRNHRKDVKRSLSQPVSVLRIDDEEAQRLAPELWQPESKASKTPRYRLAPREEA
jgi:hypothetical protein